MVRVFEASALQAQSRVWRVWYVDTTQVVSSAAVVQRSVVVFTSEVWVLVEGVVDWLPRLRLHST